MTINPKAVTGISAPVWLWPGCLLLVVWILAVRQLKLEWTFNPQYQYGWIVPLLTLLLWWRAWPSRPSPGKPLARMALPWLIGCCALLAIPLRVVQEANPDWRILDGFYAFQGVLLTALLVDYSGGRAWLWHFLFPLLFPLVAVPWPSEMEHEIIQGLQRIIASIGVEAASWMGWEAYQRGNLIVLSHGIVGIDEACSGIRSLQSCLMIALFLGDYFELARLRRVALLALGLVLAFSFNAVRAFFLISMMELHGAAALSTYHDPAGFGIAFATLLLLWILANFMAQPESRETRPALTSALFRFPRPAVVVLLSVWFAAEVVNQGWYLWHEQNTIPGPAWSLEWPLPRPDFKTSEISDSVRTILRFDEGLHGTWRDQFRWEVYFFKWKPSQVAAGLAGFHHPDICLPAEGFVMKEDLGVKNYPANGLSLPVSRYIFQEPLSGRLFYVFQIVTDDRIGQNMARSDGSGELDRLQSAWQGKRNPGQRSMLVVNQGAEDMDDAEKGMESLLHDAVTLTTANP